MPFKVKPSSHKSHASVDVFARKYHQYVSKKAIIYSKNHREEGGLRLFASLYDDVSIREGVALLPGQAGNEISAK